MGTGFHNAYVYLVIGLLILVGGLVYVRLGHKPEVHYHAGFQIFDNGSLMDYSDERFMDVVECSLAESTGVHLHNHVGDVVHVHGMIETWGDLFSYLELDEAAMATAAAELRDSQIKPYQSVQVFIGLPPVESLNPVSRERILQVEQTPEACGVL